MSAFHKMQKRIDHLEAELAHRVLGNSEAIDHEPNSATEVHVIAYATPTDSYLVVTRRSVELIDGEIDQNTLYELADALDVYRVDLYAGDNPDDQDYPECGCQLLGSALNHEERRANA